MVAMADRGIGISPNTLKSTESLGMHCMMRVSWTVRAMMEDETVFPFKSSTVKPGMESGATGHTVAGDVDGGRADAESRREGLPVAEDSAGGGRRESGQRKRVHARTVAVLELVMESSANPTRAEIADWTEGGEKALCT